MDLHDIIDRIKNALIYIDTYSNITQSNARTGQRYLVGLPPLYESTVTNAVSEWWNQNHLADFLPRTKCFPEKPYPDVKRAKCDLTFSLNNGDQYAIEVKRIQLVGDNGKNNDYSIQKTISPFLKDRSMIHDIIRLKHSAIAKKKFCIGYGFHFDFKTCAESRSRFPEHTDRVNNILRVCKNNDGERGAYHLYPLIEMLDNYLKNQSIVSSLGVQEFESWRHPCGGKCVVFGWEVL